MFFILFSFLFFVVLMFFQYITKAIFLKFSMFLSCVSIPSKSSTVSDFHEWIFKRSQIFNKSNGLFGVLCHIVVWNYHVSGTESYDYAISSQRFWRLWISLNLSYPKWTVHCRRCTYVLVCHLLHRRQLEDKVTALRAGTTIRLLTYKHNITKSCFPTWKHITQPP